MKKMIVMALAATMLYSPIARADDSQLIIGMMGAAGALLGGAIVLNQHHHHHNNYYSGGQEYYQPPPGYNNEGYNAPPQAEGGCTFKSKMQGQVKCGPGMAQNTPPLYIPAPAPVQGQQYPIVPQQQYQAPYGLPFVIPTQCQPFYYQEFVPGYGWQTLRNYRC